MATVTVEIPESLSNLQGAYDEASWQVEICPVKAGAILKRGAVVARVAADAGAVSLVVGTSQADVFGIVLDEKADASSVAVTCSVAKKGSFRGAALIVGLATDEALLAKQLRDIGIFVEGPIAPVA
jgi:hypothetical protein